MAFFTLRLGSWFQDTKRHFDACGDMMGRTPALIGAIAGFLIQRHVSEAFPKTLPCAQTDDCHPGTHE